MASRNEMKVFLAFAQYHAFTHSRCAGLDQEQALSLASQAMQQFARQHAHALPTEFPLFFFRILQTAIRHQRRLTRWHQWLPSMLAALIPLRTENAELGPLETIVVAPRAETESIETWSAEPEMTYVAHAALCILPPLQREAFLFIAWEHMDFETAAKVMACSKRRVHLNVSRARKTLAAIFAQKGLASAESGTDNAALPIAAYFESILSHENHGSDAPIFDQLAQTSEASLSAHQRRIAIPDSRSEQWASFRVHHTLLLRRLGMGVVA